jgi:hypothetical protein
MLPVLPVRAYVFSCEVQVLLRLVLLLETRERLDYSRDTLRGPKDAANEWRRRL